MRAAIVIINRMGEEETAVLLEAFQALFLALPWEGRIAARTALDRLIDEALAREEEVSGADD